MKSLIKSLSIITIFIVLMSGCQKDEIEYADESAIISSSAGIAIYKTNSDYLNKISVQYTSEGLINAVPSYTIDNKRVGKDENGDYVLKTRWLLKSGYIVDVESYVHDIYTNITIKEYVEWNEKNKVECWPDSLIKPRIVDENPFVEFYYLVGINQPIQTITIGEINGMIENGTLENYFEKIK